MGRFYACQIFTKTEIIKRLRYKRVKVVISHKMALRITIMLDDDIAKKLRLKQAKLLKTSTKSVSFSAVLNQTLREALKK